jgi:Ca-activated chloride channel homolog
VNFLAPIALAALLVGPAIYLIHWLWGSRRKVRISAVFLWADLPQASTGRARRRWPPLTLLLLLQLLAAALAALALARPATLTDPPRHLALIVDASASMQASDVAPSRFEAARARGMERLAGLRTTDLVSVIRAGVGATLLASGSPSSARAALAEVKPGVGGAALREALALASSQVGATPERRGQIVLLTDAAWPAPEPTGPLAAPVEVVAVGGGSDNQAVSNVAVRMDPTGRGQTALVEVANEADHPVRVPLRLTADGATLDERQVDVAARTRVALSIPLPLEAHQIVVRLLGHDSLSLDDTLQTIAPGGPPRDVLLLGRASNGLQRALESIAALHVRPADPSAANAAGPSAATGAAPQAGSAPAPDLTVLAGVLPTQLPPGTGPLLLVNPPSTSARLLGVGLGSGARVQEAHPLLQGLDLAALQDETPSVGGVPGWAHVVLGTVQGPLIMEGELEGRSVVALTFDSSGSGLEKSLAFPLLISNATAFLLAQADAGPALAPSDRFDPGESDIAPRAIPALNAPGGDATNAQTRGAPDQTAPNERWQWLLAAALLVLGAEWFAFARRG